MKNTQEFINNPVLEKANNQNVESMGARQRDDEITTSRNELISHYKLSELITIPALVIERLRECNNIISLMPIDINKAITHSGIYKIIDGCMDAGIFITGEYATSKDIP